MKIRTSVAVGLLALAFGCKPSELPPRAVTVRDSAGVRIVENGSVAGRIASWRLSEEPLFRTGWERDGPAFGAIRNGVIMSDGRFAVADQQADQI